MASPTSNSSTASATSSSARAGQPYQAYIDRQLRKTRLKVKTVDLLSATLGLAGGLLGYLLLVVLIDHWLFELGRTGRFLALAVLIAGLTYYIVVFLLPLIVHSINPAYAAHAIEQAEPSLKNSLLNYLMYRGGKSTTGRFVHRALEQRAALDLKHVNIDTAVDRTHAIHIGYAAAVIFVLFAGYIVLSPKDVFQTVRRVVLPWADIARPARVHIGNVHPGTAQIFFGQQVTVRAEISGIKTGELAQLLYSSNDRQTSDRPVPLERNADGDWQTSLLPDGGGVEQNITYRITAGDATSATYELRVIPTPTILVQRIQYAPPKYTQTAPWTDPQQPDIRALEGTEVTITARANRPIKTAWIELSPATATESDHPEPVLERMRANGQSASYTFTLQWDADGKTPQYSHYSLRYTDTDDNASSGRLLHAISILRDLPPDIEILTPQRSRIEMHANQRQRIEVRAVDPDFGLTRIHLRAVAGGQPLLDELLLEEPAGRTGQIVLKYDFSPQSLQLSAPAEVTYWAVAEDNRQSPPDFAPNPNVTRTRDYHILVIPAPNDTPPMPQLDARKPAPGNDPATNPPRHDQLTKTSQDTDAQNGADNAAGQEKTQGQSQDNASDRGATGAPPQDQQRPANATPPGQAENSSEQSMSNGGESGQDGTSSNQDAGQQPGQPKQQQQQSGGSDQSSQNTGAQPAVRQPSTQGAGGTAAGDNQQSGDSADQNNTGTGPLTANNSHTGNSSTGAAQSKPGSAPTDNSQQPNQSDTNPQAQPNAGDAPAAPQQATEPIHDGEAFERALQYLQDKQLSQSGSGNGTPDQPTQKSTGQQPPGQEMGTQSTDNASDQQGAAATGGTGDMTSTGAASQQTPNQDGGAQTTDNAPGQQGQDAASGGTGDQTPENAASQQTPDQGTGAQDADNAADQQGENSAGSRTGDKTPGDAAAPETPNQGMGAQGADNDTSDRQGASGQQGEDAAGGTGDETPGDAAGQQTPEQRTGAQGSGAADQQPADSGGSAGDNAAGNPADQPTPDQNSAAPVSKDNADAQQPAPDISATGMGSNPGSASKPSRNGTPAGKTPSVNPNVQPGKSPSGQQQGNAKPDQQSGGADESGKPGPSSSGADKGNESGPSTSDGGSNAPSGGTQQTATAGQDQRPNQSNQSQQTSATGAATKPGGASSGRYGAIADEGTTGAPDGDQANLDYARKATDLVLEKLKDQRDAPDPKLLKRLSWTPAELSAFLRRWQQLKQAAKEQQGDAAAELEDALRSLGLRPVAPVRNADATRDDTVSGMREAGVRSQPPSAYRDLFKAYRKSAARGQH